MTTAVITVREDEVVTSAELTMKLADIRHLPVVDPKGHVVGVLSQRDVLRGYGKSRRGRRRVAELMSFGVVTVSPNTPAHEAAGLMLEHRIGSLPVVGEEEELLGVITETDLLRVAQEALAGA